MSTLTRRTALLGALAGVTATAAAPTIAHAAAGRTTIILSPHQDDEVVRLAHYATIATDRGDAMVLVQATDGSATAVRTKLGVDGPTIARWRDREQALAWDWLTDGRGTITHLGERDGAANADRIYTGLRSVVDTCAGAPEVYVATYIPDATGAVSADQHTDHVACVRAAQRLAADGVTVRFALHPTSKRGGTSYRARNTQQAARVEGAVHAYQTVGRRSTKNLDLVVGRANRVRSS